MKYLVVGLISLVSLSQTAHASEIHFCWAGANGYHMVGSMKIASNGKAGGIVTENDVAAFRISGYQNGTPLGGWSLAERQPDTTWHLRFDRVSHRFLVGNDFGSPRSQGWNANGAVSNCGNPGFGFNSGNAGQDLCVNGRFVSDSTVDPSTELHVSHVPFAPDCSADFPMSKRN